MKRSAKRRLQGPIQLDAIVCLAEANDNVAESDERSITVAAAATRLGCNTTTVRELIRKNLLAGHRVGKTATPTGIRIKMWSIKAYEERYAIGSSVGRPPASDGAPSDRKGRNKANENAAARLKALGA